MKSIAKLTTNKILPIVSTLLVLMSLSVKPALADIIEDAKGGVETIDNGGDAGSVEDIIKNVISTLLFIIGGVSVAMIVVGGVRYILSNGDPQQATNARNTIIYSIIGLVVAVLAWAIVNYVLGILYDDSPFA